MPPNSGCGLAVPTTRAVPCNAPSRKRPAIGTPLAIAPGSYRVGNLRLPSHAQLLGVRGATKLLVSDGTPLIAATGAERVTLSGFVFDGLQRRLPDRRALVHLDNASRLRIIECEVVNAGGTGIALTAADGEISGTHVADSADVAIHSLDARGLLIAHNAITGAGNNGIQVWRGKAADDGTIVSENRIETIHNRSGGSGQYGNAINVFRAGNVIVRGNRIKNCAFTAVRGNAASNIQIVGNTSATPARSRCMPNSVSRARSLQTTPSMAQRSASR